MHNLRSYGAPPYRVAVIHGGPGAAGEVAPVARELSAERGVLEPLQTAHSLQGQVEELRAVLETHAALPVTLVGHSWGAWLAYLVAAQYPALVGKLILVSSGAFEEAYVAQLQATRLGRLSERERAEWQAILRALDDPASPEKDRLLARLGALAARTDSYDPLPDEGGGPDATGVQGDIYQRVWQAAAELRRSGELLALGARVRCPVVAIHGDYDPSPVEGVYKPLSTVLQYFRLILLERCGHTPWLERQAREAFYCVLREELDARE